MPVCLEGSKAPRETGDHETHLQAKNLGVLMVTGPHEAWAMRNGLGKKKSLRQTLGHSIYTTPHAHPAAIEKSP